MKHAIVGVSTFGWLALLLINNASAAAPGGGPVPLMVTGDFSRFGSKLERGFVPLVMPISAPQATAGACCLGDGSCVPASSESQCTAMGGVFLPGENCSTSPCGPGACCSETSCAIADAFSCITAGRTFAGAGTICADDPCSIPVGACCIDGACSAITQQACTAAGGTWLGPGTVCGPVTCIDGACCFGETCEHMQGHQCVAQGGTFVPGATCAQKPCAKPNACPGGTLFSQSLDPPTEFLAGTSEASSGLRRWENFSGVAGAIQSLTWWGLDLHPLGGSLWSECVESDPTFSIAFHKDAGGVPGDVVCTYTLLATRTPLGVLYLGTELNQYEVTLPSPCVLVNGWVSIVGLGDPECWFLWMSAGTGGSYCDHCLPSPQDMDLAVCLQGPKGGVFGACCDDATGQCTDGVDIAQCVAPGLRFSPNETCAELEPPCGVVLGACCRPDATCSLTEQRDCTTPGATWLGPWTICSSCPCITPCPPGGISEGEPVCFDGYVDTFNGGCFAGTIAFTPIELGQTICGRSGVYVLGTENVADFDWYQVQVPARMELTWRVKAEFRPRGVIVDGTRGCKGLEVLGASDVYECDEVIVTATVNPGTHWLVVVPWAFTDSSPCGARYVAIAEGRVLNPADLDGDGDVDGIDLAMMLGQWTGAATYAPCPPFRAADLNQDCRVNGLDLAMLLAGWNP